MRCQPQAPAPLTQAPEPTPAISASLRELAAQRGFSIGTAVAVEPFHNEPVYTETLAREFSRVVAAGVLKFAALRPAPDRYDFTESDALVAFAERHGMQVHGSTLVWYQSMPEWLTRGNYSKTDAREILRDHIITVVGRYRDRVASWDVVNEIITENGRPRPNYWSEQLGPEYVELAFRWAHEDDPDAHLIYNEGGAEGMGEKSDGVYQLARDLKQRGVPSIINCSAESRKYQPHTAGCNLLARSM
jgi:endo-1,4-beta-xylanase